METKARQVELVRELQRKRSRRIGHEGYDERMEVLGRLKDMLMQHEERWMDALQKDLGKSAVEAFASELGVLLNELDYVMKHLKSWMQPIKQKRILLTGLEKTTVFAYPYGSVLVLSPWNYPLQLALMPVIGALAAGNGVVLKPSEFAPTTSALLVELVQENFSRETFYVVEGGETIAQRLTEMDWDFICFTGSKKVGQTVYEAATKNITPVLLELGGKNPCVIDESGMTAKAIQEIAWGKFLNAGQSCIAPDTVYVPRAMVKQFLEQMIDQIQTFYSLDPSASNDFGRIIHAKEINRLIDYLDQGEVYYGGEFIKNNLYLSPTLMIEIEPGSSVLEEEIFGPILPIIPYDSLDEVVDLLREQSVPLVLYVFSNDEYTVEKLQSGLESGTVSVNRLITHATSPHVPFGGKGASGLGRYHGQASFSTFSYQRSLYMKKELFQIKQQFPPYTASTLAALRKLRSKLF